MKKQRQEAKRETKVQKEGLQFSERRTTNIGRQKMKAVRSQHSQFQEQETGRLHTERRRFSQRCLDILRDLEG